MRERRRPTSTGDVVRLVVGVTLIVVALVAWGQHHDDLGTSLTGRHGPLSAGTFIAISGIGGVALVLVGLLWRGRERR